MFANKKEFIDAYTAKLVQRFGKPVSLCGKIEKYDALVQLITDEAAEIRTGTLQRNMEEKKKEIYYFSMEFLMGKLLRFYLLNLGVEDIVRDGLAELGEDLNDLAACEADPGLGNGGLGRLAACFLDSLATLDINATGMGIRYRFGLFRQRIVSGWQQEEADTWLANGYPWETKKPDEAVTVKFGGYVQPVYQDGKTLYQQRDYYGVLAVPYDVPVIGYQGKTVNTLRLWRAQPVNESLDLEAFNRGDYSGAVKCRNDAEAISCILYPDDTSYSGKELRLKQEYFFVAAGLASIVQKFKRENGSDWDRFPALIGIHINDTHPTLCIPELMRILIDEENLDWNRSWDIVTRTLSYTNHTVLPEALEKWPVDLFRRLLPRIYMITEEIDRRFRASFDSSGAESNRLMESVSVIGDGQIRMANLSVLGSFSVNGVAGIHTEILKADTLKDFYTIMPGKFNNKTNGVSHRRFMVSSNPALAGLITEAIGDGWISDMSRLEELTPFAEDSAFLERLTAVKRQNKEQLARYIQERNHITVDPDSIFDIQVKRIHAYKRQLLNILKVMSLYNDIKADPNAHPGSFTFVFAGKAAQSYILAKEIIKYICSVADIVNSDPDMDGRLRVVFLEDFNVSLGQIIYPAAEISEQISTAGKEASGTGNMKFMMNGAVTLGTMDGANVEICQLAGRDNMFLFGMSAEEAMELTRSRRYSPQAECAADPRLQLLTEQMVNGFFRSSGTDFRGIYNSLLNYGDEYFVLKDFASYLEQWSRACRVHGDQPAWARMSLMNIAKSGYFSSDRTIREYAKDIWHVL